MPHSFITPVALSVPYDPTTSGLLATDVQTAIDLLNTTAAVSASPGFTWGRSGNAPAGTYLSNDSVPSNTTGRIVPIATGNITSVFVACGVAATFQIVIEKNVGGVFTVLGTFTVTAARIGIFSASIPVTYGMEIAVRLGTGSCQNPVVGIIIKGTV